MAKKIADALGVPFELFSVLAADSKAVCSMPVRDAEFLGRRLLELLTEPSN